MALSTQQPNFEFARPLEISDDGLNTYFQARAQKQRQMALEQSAAAAQQTAQDKADAARKKDYDANMKALSTLPKDYDMGGFWQPEQEALLADTQKQLSQMYANDNPEAAQFLMKRVGMLQSNLEKAKAFQTYAQQQAQKLHQADDSIDPALAQQYYYHKLAYNADGSKKNLEDVDPAQILTGNPLLDPAFNAVNDNALGGRLAKQFVNNTMTSGHQGRKDGITTGHTTTTTLPAYMRLDATTGRPVLNTEAIGNDPVLHNTFFDQFRTRAGKTALVKDEIYRQHMNDIGLQGAVAREINTLNKGKKPGDSGYVEPNSPQADIVGRAVFTRLLAGQQHGNVSIKTNYGQDKNSGPQKPDKSTVNAENVVQTLHGIMTGDPNYVQGLNQKQGTGFDYDITDHPGLKNTDIGVMDVTPLLKNVNVGERGITSAETDKVYKYVPTPASKIEVKKSDPGAMYVYLGDNPNPERVDKNNVQEFLNNIQKYNPKMDTRKINAAVKRIFGEVKQPESVMPAPEQPKLKKPNIVTKAVDTIKNSVAKWSKYSSQ